MNKHIMPKLNRRAFVVGTAAAGAGLSLGFDIPFGGPTVVRAADGSPEVNAWVVIRPDDTVVIRIARSEMGQGTLTGLAQLVAEELECDWSKVTTEYPTPGSKCRTQARLGRFLDRRQPRHPHQSHEYVRKGGATARMMLVQAAANEWKVPAAECTAVQQRHHAYAVGQEDHLRQGGGSRRQAANRRADVKLKDPKDWKIAGKALKRLDTADKTTGKMIYGIDVKLPGMLNAAIKDCPVFGGKLKSFDEAKIAGMKGVKKVVRVGDTAVAVVADTWWHAKTALDALPIVWDEGENAKVSSESIAEMAGRGPRQRAARLRRQPERRRQGRDRGRGEEGRGGLQLSLPEPRLHGADERHRALHGGQMRGLVRHAERRSGVRRGAGSVRPAGRQMRGLQAHARRRLRPARPCRLCPAGRADRQADAGHADQAVVVARRGHAARHLSSDHAMQADRRPRRQGQSRSALHMRISGQSILTARAAGSAGERNGSGDLPGAQRDRARRRSATPCPNLLIEHAMRNPHVPPGFWRGVNVNQNAIYIECFMDELAKEAGQDPLEFRRKLMANIRSISPCSTPSPNDRLGQTGARRRNSAASRSSWATAAMSPAAAEVSVQRQQE